jgi:hypothetical protein
MTQPLLLSWSKEQSKLTCHIRRLVLVAPVSKFISIIIENFCEILSIVFSIFKTETMTIVSDNQSENATNKPAVF